jgi:hypothetical protein
MKNSQMRRDLWHPAFDDLNLSTPIKASCELTIELSEMLN